MVRTIVQLTEHQSRTLRERAREQGVSVSELVRRGVDVVIKSGVSHAEMRRRAREAVGFASSGDTDVSVRHDDYLAEAYKQ
jgi:hypothetical protein